MASSSISDLSLAFILLAVGIWLLARRPTGPKTSVVCEERDERRGGEWTPVEFIYPEFEAWHSFDIRSSKPTPYRPFRWGRYAINMGIRAMQWDSWIELDNQYLELLAVRKARMAERGDKVVRTLPGAERAALEVCTELASYLAKRYPQVFRVHRVHDKGGLGRGDSVVGKDGGRVKIVEILPTGDKWDLDEEDPMMVCGILADDIAILVEGSDGLYTFRAGSICVPGSWRLVDKIGLSLADIHLMGNVHKYKENLQFSMDRFFRKMTVEKPVARNNYSFQVAIGPELGWISDHHGDEDLYDQATKGPRADNGVESMWQPPKPATDISQVHFRSERQTLRRMPQTGCVCFTIRTYLHPVTEIALEPGVPGRLAAAIRGWDAGISRQKDKALYGNTMLPWLDDLHGKQIQAGIIDIDDKTNRYPF